MERQRVLYTGEREFQVVERRRTEDDFASAFARHGFTVEYGATDHLFCFLLARRQSSSSGGPRQ